MVKRMLRPIWKQMQKRRFNPSWKAVALLGMGLLAAPQLVSQAAAQTLRTEQAPPTALPQVLPALRPELRSDLTPQLRPQLRPQLLPQLHPQAAFLSKTKNQQTREFYITVVNTSTRLYENNQNPVSVSINGQAYRASVFAKKYSDRYYLYAAIRPQEEGAIFVKFADETPYKDWQQCQSLEVSIDLRGKSGQKEDDSQQTARIYKLQLHDTDYSSDCRHRDSKAIAVRSPKEGAAH